MHAHHLDTYLDYFDCPRNVPNPILDYRHDETWLNQTATEYNAFLMEQLLSTVSQKWTHTYLSNTKDAIFDNRSYKSALKNINLDTSLTQPFLYHALRQLDRTLKDTPCIMQRHIENLSILKNLLGSDKKARTGLNTRLTEGQKKTQKPTTLSPLPLLICSKEDIDTLLSHALINNRNHTPFLDQLIDAEIRACHLLCLQIKALECQLTAPALPALYAFRDRKEAFQQKTRTTDMSIETFIVRVGATYRDINLLTELYTELHILSNMTNEWNQVHIQHTLLLSLNQTLTNYEYNLTWNHLYDHTILQGIFHTPPLNATEFNEKIANLMTILSDRIQTLTTVKEKKSSMIPTLPLLSLTSLLVTHSDRIYLNEEPDIFKEKLHILLANDVFVSPENVLDLIGSLSPKETLAVTFEINLLKLFDQFSNSLQVICEQTKSYLSNRNQILPYREKIRLNNQYYYAYSLSSTLLHQLESLKKRCTQHIINGSIQWHHLESIITKLESIENATHDQSFILNCFKEKLQQLNIENHSLPPQLLINQAAYYVNLGQYFTAAGILDQLYRALHEFAQEEAIEHYLSVLEEQLSEQLATLLNHTHAMLMLTHPLDLVFDKHSNNTLITSLKNYSERLTHLVRQSIFSQAHTVFSRSKAYARWLQVADFLYQRGDLFGHYAIATALYSLRDLYSAIKLFDEHTNALHLRYVMSYSESMHQQHLIAVPYWAHLLDYCDQSLKTSNEQRTIGYLKSNDPRLDNTKNYQVMYHLYKNYNDLLTQALNEPLYTSSDWQEYYNKIDQIVLLDDENHNIHIQARITEQNDQAFLAKLAQSARLIKRSHTWSEITPDDCLHLATEIGTFRSIPGQYSAPKNIFTQKKYVKLNALTETREAVEANLIGSDEPTVLEAFDLALFTNYRALGMLFSVLKTNPRFHSIRTIDLHSNTPIDIEVLQRLLPHILCYEGINLDNNKITNMLFYHFIQSLHSYKNDIRIRRLSLYNNLLGIDTSPQMFYLAQFLHNYQGLVDLNLNQNFLNEQDAPALADALAYSSALRTIDLGMNPLGDTGIEALCNTFSSLIKLEVIKLFCCKLTDKSVDRIAALMSKNQNIIHIDFRGNNQEYHQHQNELYDEKHKTSYDPTYKGISEASCMHLSTLLTIKQDYILEKARTYQTGNASFTVFHAANELKDNASFMPTPKRG